MRVRITPEFPGLVVSDDGQIRGPSGKWLKGGVCPQGYRHITVGSRDCQRVVRVHVIVCLAFHGPRPPGHDVRHLNGDKTDNRAENLFWGTRSQNVQDAREHGTLILGSASPLTSLTDDDVRSIRSSHKTGAELARMFRVSPMTVSRIRNRKTWRHI